MTDSLEKIAKYIVSDGKGILAADESTPTCTKRFDSIGVESTEDPPEYYRVFDWFDVRSGTSHDHDSLETEDAFCSKIYFYKSERIDGNHENRRRRLILRGCRSFESRFRRRNGVQVSTDTKQIQWIHEHA